jgi:hypothetical protein
VEKNLETKKQFLKLRAFKNMLVHNADSLDEMQLIKPIGVRVSDFLDIMNTYEREILSVERTAAVKEFASIPQKVKTQFLFITGAFIIIPVLYFLQFGK